MLRNRKYLTQEEVSLLLKNTKNTHSPERDYCLILMSFIHGLRVSEANSLKLSDISLSDKCLYIRRLKCGFSTTHPILDDEFIALKKWLKVRNSKSGAECEWLFTSRQGGQLTRQRIYQIIRSLGKLAGVSVSSHPHMLRHACGYALADRGIDTRLIQDYLGHRNIRHTVRYTAGNAQRFNGVWKYRSRPKKLHLGPNCNQV